MRGKKSEASPKKKDADDSDSGLSAGSSSEGSSDSESDKELHKDKAFKTEARAAPPSEDDAESRQRREALLNALSKHRLFRDVSREFLEVLLNKSKRQCLAPNEALKLQDGGSLYIVETGALRCRVGSEGNNLNASIAGRGAVVNGAGFLSLLSAAGAYRPRRVSFKPEDHPRSNRPHGYDVQGYTGKSPSIYTDRMGSPKPTQDQSGLTDTQRCFYNLCPYSSYQKSNAGARGAWLNFTVRGGGPGEQPQQAGTKALPDGGCTVLALPSYQAILECGKGAKVKEGEEYSRFKSNCDEVSQLWRELMSKFNAVIFPGAPMEVIYEMAASADHLTFLKNDDMVCEGDYGEGGDALILILEGVAMVLKKVKSENGVPQMETIGRLRAGAVIGDISLIGAEIPRSATVRAKTDVEALKIPARLMMELLGRFPGVLEGCVERLAECADCLKERLLTRTEVASSLNLFTGCDLGFVNDVANSGERRLLFAGDPVVQQGSTAGTLFVLEHGRCTVEVGGIGRVAEVPTGNCFGERTLLGIADKANATVRVFTPFALVLAIPRDVLHLGLEKHPDEKAHFERLKTAPMDGRIAGSKVRHVELFRPCGIGFLGCLNAAVTSNAYLPGQTIVVEGDVEDDPRMFVLTGGIVMVEKDGKALARMSPGATFGEQALLGLSKERPVTIKAVTLCFVMAIPKSVFDKAVTEFPEERDRFQRLDQNAAKDSVRVAWPCLRGESSRLLYLLDLYAEKASCSAGDKRLSKPPFCESAILVLEGEIAVFDSEGAEIAVLTSGCCFNERILVGARSKPSERLVPLTDCQVRLVSRETWGKVMAEFPHDLNRVRSSILAYMSAQAEIAMGYEAGSATLLREKTAFFSSVSEDFAKAARRLVEDRIFEPGAEIVRAAPENEEEQDYIVPPQELYILLSGRVWLENPHLGSRRVKFPQAIGEGCFVGSARYYPFAVKADTLCIVQVLRREAIVGIPGDERDKQIVERLIAEARSFTLPQLRTRLQGSYSFRYADMEIITHLTRVLDVVVFAPGSVILQQGTDCLLGVSQFFLVLVGKVEAMGAVGTIFGVVGHGEVFGEVGAFGLSPTRSATARAWEAGLVVCLRFDGKITKNAVEQCPHSRAVFEKAWIQLEAQNMRTELDRRSWIQSCAVPALAKTPLLYGCPREFLNRLAVQLKEVSYRSGQIIARVGNQLESMLVMLKGTASIESRSGECIGRMMAGSAFGEVNALGLFDHCMATLHATSDCRVLMLPEHAVREALTSSGCKEEGIGDGYQTLIDSRHEQVREGFPITALGIGASQDDVRVRAIALLAERFDLQPGETLTPISDDDPCGPYYAFVVQGRATVEIGHERHIVYTLVTGSLFVESLAAHYGAIIRAESACEVCRVRQSDFLMVVGASTSAANDWIWRFKVTEKVAFEKLHKRLQSIQGLLNLTAPNAKDEEIHAWKVRKEESIVRAKRRKDDQEAALPPLLKSKTDSKLLPVIEESVEPQVPSRNSLGEAKAKKQGLQAYPTLNLPRIKAHRGLSHSQSEPILRKS